MLETHLRATWEGHNRVRETRVRRAISEFMDEAFAEENDQELSSLAKSGVEKLKRVLEVDGVCVVDVRGMHVHVSYHTTKLTTDRVYKSPGIPIFDTPRLGLIGLNLEYIWCRSAGPPRRRGINRNLSTPILSLSPHYPYFIG